ncbi:cytochrome c [Geobacter sp. AOG1]|nr:cytochrome c [Geobacter sp. AOG1]
MALVSLKERVLMLKLPVIVCMLLLGSAVPLLAAGQNARPHIDRNRLPYGCGTCHVGFDFNSGGGSDGCVSCHGKSRPSREFVNSNAVLSDVESEFRKRYRHPTFDVRGVHRANEVLPEQNPRASRHADCVDCHNPHLTNSANVFAGIKGKRVGNSITEIVNEYDLCYLCHGDSLNLPGRATNKRAEFSLNNPSFHPMEGEGKNLAVVSLLKPYREKKTEPGDVSVIGCRDCHGSESSSSPRGPHGSANQYILVENYSTRDREPESATAYALCYRCHNRTSILGDESFRLHSLHIKGKVTVGMNNGTSCYTCHNSHGSSDNKYLLRFNRDIVSASSSGLLKFTEKGTNAFRGECYLTCHGVDHNPKSY